jgi:tryptophan synthase beta chain
MTTPNSYRTGPDEKGLFGIYGGRFDAADFAIGASL